MKCPKCGYISFDYNEICPKCNKGIAVDRDKLKLPDFRPDPPSLLGTLTGKVTKSQDVDLMESAETAEMLDQELDFGSEELEFTEEESFAADTTEPALDDTYSFEVPLEEVTEESAQEPEEEFEFLDSEEDIEELELPSIESTEDLSIDIEEPPAEESDLEPISEPSIEDQTEPEPEQITLDDVMEAEPDSGLPSFDEETASLELEDLMEAEPEMTLEEQEPEITMETEDTITLESEEQVSSELEISLEEPEPEISFEEQEPDITLEEQEPEITLEEEQEPEVTLEEQTPEASFDLDKTITLDLDNLPEAEMKISPDEGSGPEGEKEEELLSLEDLKDEEIESLISDSQVSKDESVFDRELDLALDDALSTDEIPLPEKTSLDEEDFSLDLESLDLDLDLEEPEDK